MRVCNRTCRLLGGLYATAVLLGALSSTARAGVIYDQGFEADNSGWFTPTRVASGTGGITAESGDYFALATTDFTRWGAYRSAFPTDGWSTSLGIYLDLNATSTNDTRFDWDSAVNDASGNFLRDFVFNAGFYNDSDSTGTGPRFVISASNNAGRGSSYPKNPGRDPFAITQSGWYDFQHTFYNNGGYLAADLSIIDHATGVTLHTWTLTTTDLISTVGGNRYGWFASNEFSSLAIDNATLTLRSSPVPEPATLASAALGVLALAGFGWSRRGRSA